MDLAKTLRDAGLRVVEVGDWRNHHRPYSFNPVGVMVHHTAGPLGGNNPSLNTCLNGVPDVPGPLANVLIGRDGTVFIISDGHVNGSGTGNRSALDRVRAGTAPSGNATSKGTVAGNSYFYNIEVENNGVGETYPTVQIDALVRLCAAICKAYSWNQNHVIHHREWTNRKIDMSWYGPLRESVAAHLAGSQPTPKPPTPPVDSSPGPEPHPPVVKEIRTSKFIHARVYIPNKAYGAGYVWLDAERLLGKSPSAIIGVIVRGPYPPDDGWELERADVHVRAKISRKNKDSNLGIALTMTGCKDPDGCEVLVTFA